MSTSRVYRERDHPVKDGVANELGLGEMLYLTAATKQSCPYCVLSVLVFDTVRYGEVRRALSGAKGRNQRTYGLGGAPVVIVHGNQRHELA